MSVKPSISGCHLLPIDCPLQVRWRTAACGVLSDRLSSDALSLSDLTSAVAGHVHLLAHLVTGAEALDLVTVGLLDHHHHGLQCYNKSFVSSFSPGPLTLHCLNYTNMDNPIHTQINWFAEKLHADSFGYGIFGVRLSKFESNDFRIYLTGE